MAHPYAMAYTLKRNGLDLAMCFIIYNLEFIFCLWFFTILQIYRFNNYSIKHFPLGSMCQNCDSNQAKGSSNS